MGRSNYDGPGWKRPTLLGECERRGVMFPQPVSDQMLRNALILTDQPSAKADRGPWIMTFTGKHFYPLAPRLEDFERRDIAHSLALTCRFNGHLNQFYSVAQHSIILQKLLPEELTAWALLHDAAEAYLGDLVRPIKQSWQFFTEAEDRLLEAMAQSFRLTWPMPDKLKQVDFALGLAEAEAFGMDIGDWSVPDDFRLPLPDIKPFIGANELCNWSWRAVESVFMRLLSEI